MDDLVQRAKDLAHRAHAGQVDKAGRPYIEHVARVAAACADDPEAEAVAWLHDVLEDAPGFNGHAFQLLGDRLFKSASVLTYLGCSLDLYYEAILRNPIALRVKLADIADNADESRLALLDDKTANRLRRKYANAIKQLTERSSKEG